MAAGYNLQLVPLLSLSVSLWIGLDAPGSCPQARAQEGAPRADARAADTTAVDAVMASFAKAFEARDAKALAAHFTSEGEYRNAQGVVLQGRDALERSFATFFAATPEVSARVAAEDLRFLSRDSAWQEGRVSVRRGPADDPGDARYTALLVREEGHWKLALLSESHPDGPSTADLAWLIGQWASAPGQAAEITATYEWAPNKNFIHVRFTVKEQQLEFTGNQVIGIDPTTGRLRSWTFEADGGVAEADWSKDGDHWVLDVAGTLFDGRSIVETNVLRRVGDDALTFQSVDRLIDDQSVADLPPVKVVRVKDGK